MLPFNPGWSSLVILVTGLLSIRLLRVTAQQTSVICLSQYGWMNNSKNQNPCLVAAYVDGVCSNTPYDIQPLDPGEQYGTYDENACVCSTVPYCLLSACAACQNRTYINWSYWSVNCSTTYIGYPESIPNGTAIPQWAYQDVASSGDFNVTLAEVVGDSPESTAIGASVTTSPTSSPTPSTSSTSSASTSSANDSGAIAGGIVGGVVGLVVVVVAIWYFVRRHRPVGLPSAVD